MRRQISICDTVVQAIKIKISQDNLSLQAISRNTGVSYYTVWMIKEGNYDTKDPLKREAVVDKEMFNVNEKENWLA